MNSNFHLKTKICLQNFLSDDRLVHETLSYSCTTLLTSILWICICVTFIIYDYDSFKFPLSPITLMIYLINNFINFLCPRPCRSKGSQQGWEKQHNKSFHTNIFIASFIAPWPTALRILYLLTLYNLSINMNNAISLVYLLTYLNYYSWLGIIILLG